MSTDYQSVAIGSVLSISLIIGCSVQRDSSISTAAKWLQGTGEEVIPSDLVLELRRAEPSAEKWVELLVASGPAELRMGRIMALSSEVFLDRFGEVDGELFEAMCKMCLSDRTRFRSLFGAVVANRRLDKDDSDEIVRGDDRYLARFVTWLNSLEAPLQGKSMFGVLVLSSAFGREDFIKIAVEKDAVAGWTAIQDEVTRNGDYYVFEMRDHEFQIDLDRARSKTRVGILEQEPGGAFTE